MWHPLDLHISQPKTRKLQQIRWRFDSLILTVLLPLDGFDKILDKLQQIFFWPCICTTLRCFRSLLHRYWHFSVDLFSIMCFSVILGAVQNFSQALTDNFLHEDVFDYQVPYLIFFKTGDCYTRWLVKIFYKVVFLALEHIFSFGHILCFSRNLGPQQVFRSEKNKDLGKVSSTKSNIYTILNWCIATIHAQVLNRCISNTCVATRYVCMYVCMRCCWALLQSEVGV